MIRNVILATALVLLPSSSQALQLHWASGSSCLSFSEATRCTLVVAKEMSDGDFPSEWRLAWVANHCPHIVVLADTLSSSAGTTQVADVATRTLAEARGNVTTAEF